MCRVACTKAVFGSIELNKHCQTQCSPTPTTSPCAAGKGCRLECENEIPQCVLGCVGGSDDGKCKALPKSKQKYRLECRQHAICMNNQNDGDDYNDIGRDNDDVVIFDDEFSNEAVFKSDDGQNKKNNKYSDEIQSDEDSSYSYNLPDYLLRNIKQNDKGDKNNDKKQSNSSETRNNDEEEACTDEDSFEHDAHYIINNNSTQTEPRQKIKKDTKYQKIDANNHEKNQQIHYYENCCTCRDIDNLTLSYQSALNRIMKSTAEYDTGNIPSLTELIHYYHQNGFEDCCQCAKKEVTK